jgi:predicted subunit of tRNA(5-methylaminomethyl-2-thiouridylate) methyltransferase
VPSLYGVYILPQETLGYVVQVKRLYSQELQIPTEQSLKVEKSDIDLALKNQSQKLRLNVNKFNEKVFYKC